MDIIANDPAGGRAGGPSGVRLPRWVRPVAAGAAAVCLLGYVVTHRLANPEDTSATWRTLTPPAASTRSAVPATLTGRPGYGPLGLRVLVGGTAPRIVDLDTGGEHPVGGVPRPPDSDVSLAAADGAVVANVFTPGRITSYLVHPGRPTRRLSATGFTLPGQDGMTLITVEFPQALSVPPPQAWRSSLIIGQRADGRRLWQWRSAAPTLPVRDTAAGLLVRPLDTAPHLLLVRRETGQILRRFAGIEVAVGGDSILQARRTGPRYALVRTRLDTGATTTFTLPGRQAPDYGVVAPGDRWVALAFPSTAGASGTTVAVADLHSGAVWPVPGVWAPGESGRREAGFAWSADGESLVVAVDGGGRDPLRIGIWRPDQPFEPVTVLPHEFTGDTLSIATFP